MDANTKLQILRRAADLIGEAALAQKAGHSHRHLQIFLHALSDHIPDHLLLVSIDVIQAASADDPVLRR